eukprot:scaffold59465_cov58-Cyclotella_meneghiniana.AAC.2
MVLWRVSSTWSDVWKTGGKIEAWRYELVTFTTMACVVPKVLHGKVVIVTPLWLVNIRYWMEGRRFGYGDALYNNNPMVVDMEVSLVDNKVQHN